MAGKPTAAAAAGAGAGAAAWGTGAGAGGVDLPLNRFHRKSSTAAPISHGSQRMNPDLVAVVAAAAALAAAPAPPATAAPARRAASAAGPVMPPMNAAGLAKPSAPVRRLSSAPCRFGPCSPSSDASELALRPFSPMNFFRNVSSNGTTIASRLVADELLIPLLDDSAFTSAPLLSPNSAGTRLLVPAFSRALTPDPPPPKSPARLPSEFTSRFAPLISDSRPAAPSGVAPFWAMPPSTAGSSDVNADCVEPCDSPRNCPASFAKSPPSACWASESRFAAMSVPPSCRCCE